MLKKSVLVLVVALLLAGAAYAWALYDNNRSVALPDRHTLEAHRERAIQWLVDHREDVSADSNVMLWWMLYENEKVMPDARTGQLLDRYLAGGKLAQLGLWAPLFDGPKHLRIDPLAVAGLDYYQKHFIYALNCAANLPQELPLVKAQNDADFCHHWPWMTRPACSTHQLMGIHFLRRQSCGDVALLDATIASLLRDIETRMFWDIRVVDVYLQRLLLLQSMGAGDRIRPAWIVQLLEHQLSDGGWANFEPIVPLGGGRQLGFGPRGLAVAQAESSFHTTAQGVYLLSLLLAGDAK